MTVRIGLSNPRIIDTLRASRLPTWIGANNGRYRTKDKGHIVGHVIVSRLWYC